MIFPKFDNLLKYINNWKSDGRAGSHAVGGKVEVMTSATTRRALPWSTLFILAYAALVSTSWAAGKKPPAPTGPTTPNPVRRVELLPVGHKVFEGASGSKLDLSHDLNAMFETALTRSVVLQPFEPSIDAPCDDKLQIEADFSTLQLEVGSAGLVIGYTPSSEGSSSIGIEGSLGVKIGLLGMDVRVRKHELGGKSSVLASKVSQPLGTVSLDLGLKIGDLKVGPKLTLNPVFEPVLRAMFANAVSTLVGQAPQMERLGWTARVIALDEQTGMLYFDKGWDDLIGNQQAFTVYSIVEDPSGARCRPFLPVADVHTIRVDQDVSLSVIDETIGSRGIKVGDIVKIRRAGAAR